MQLLTATAAADDVQTFCPNFLSMKLFEARVLSFLNEGRFSTLSPTSAEVFLKMGCESGKFRARGVEDVHYF